MSDINVIIVLYVVLGIFISLLGLFEHGIITVPLPPVILQLGRYGKANAPSKEKPAFVRSIEVPKSWFAHFYLYIAIAQSGIFLTLVNLYVRGSDPNQSSIYGWLSSIVHYLVPTSQNTFVIPHSTALLVSFLFLFHVTRRLYESKYVSVYGDTKMNIIHYVVAFVHYTGSALSLIANNPGFTGESKSANVMSTWTWNWNDFGVAQWMGIVLFLYGNIQQNKAHVIFANLRKKGDKVVTRNHQIPRGGLFELVSCPNYFAEILIYISFALMLSFQNSCWLAVLFWVFANQVTAGGMNHLWYKRKFPEYPKNRKAIIPYIY